MLLVKLAKDTHIRSLVSYPTQGPFAPVNRTAFSSNVRLLMKALALTRAASHPVPRNCAGRNVSIVQAQTICKVPGIKHQSEDGSSIREG